MNLRKRNRFAGKGKNTESGSNLKTGRDYKKETAYQSSPSRIKYRVALNRKNRQSHAAGRTRVGDGKDQSHCKCGGMRPEAQSTNRARNRGKKNCNCKK